jgi:predicted nucleic acid-binding protein
LEEAVDLSYDRLLMNGSLAIKVLQTPWKWKTRMDKTSERINLVRKTCAMDQPFSAISLSLTMKCYFIIQDFITCVHVPERHENFAVSVLVSYTKINSCVYSLEGWESFHISRRTGKENT